MSIGSGCLLSRFILNTVPIFRVRPEEEVNARIEGMLVAEVNMVVLDTLELIVSVSDLL